MNICPWSWYGCCWWNLISFYLYLFRGPGPTPHFPPRARGAEGLRGRGRFPLFLWSLLFVPSVRPFGPSLSVPYSSSQKEKIFQERLFTLFYLTIWMTELFWESFIHSLSSPIIKRKGKGTANNISYPSSISLCCINYYFISTSFCFTLFYLDGRCTPFSPLPILIKIQ